MGEERVGARAFHIGAYVAHIDYALTRPAIARLGSYLGVIGLPLLVWRVQDRMFSTSYIEIQTESLSPLQEKQLDAFLEMNRLLVTLATATMGALGFMLSAGRERIRLRRELLSAAASAVFAGCSLYFGYLGVAQK
jgi:hypothetical protein